MEEGERGESALLYPVARRCPFVWVAALSRRLAATCVREGRRGATAWAC